MIRQQFASQATRFELKYLVSERCALSVRQFVSSSLEPDSNARPGLATPSYRVHSLYLDSADLSLYRQSVDGDRKRFKLRLRYYDDPTDTPIFLEIKHKVDRGISKDRVAIRPAAVRRLLRGGSVRSDDLVGTETCATADRFVGLAASVGARETAVVSYDREAYSSADSKLRVTFDRRLAVSPPDPDWPLVRQSRPFFVRTGGVIVELKFNGVFPAWLSHLVQIFGLERRPMPKYVTCLRAMRSPDYRAMRRFEPSR